jgi:hypothetical protein
VGVDVRRVPVRVGVLVAPVDVGVGSVGLGVLVFVLVFVGVRDPVGLGMRVREVAANVAVADRVAAVGVRVTEGLGVDV